MRIVATINRRTPLFSSSLWKAIFIYFILTYVVGNGSEYALAQVTPITPSGLHTQVSDSISVGGYTQYNITGGTRPDGGMNLFHSFGDFNVPTNNIANFFNDSGLATSNILARVTGTNGNNPTLSSIYGTIQTTGFPNANLFLMNPAGFLFGSNATVNVGGMMTFTTADYLKLTGIGQFNAIPDVAADTLLSAAPVAAFGFLGSNPNADPSQIDRVARSTATMTLAARSTGLGDGAWLRIALSHWIRS